MYKFAKAWTVLAMGTLALSACSVAHADLLPAVAPQDAVAQSFTPGQRVVFFGSSTTSGVGASHSKRRWTTLLSRYIECTELNAGLSGSSLSETPGLRILTGVQRWQQDVVKLQPDHVIIMYGANDMDRGLPVEGRNRFKESLRTLLSGLEQSLAPGQLVVLTPQRSRVSPERRRPYDQALREAAIQFRAPFFDVGADPAFQEPDLNAPDGLHLNNRGHALLASELAAQLAERGLIPRPPLARGGTAPDASASVPLPGGVLRVDALRPLTGGVVESLRVRWLQDGDATLGVMRPDDEGRLQLMYRTRLMQVKAGDQVYPVPHWRVLAGDRLCVWTAQELLGGLPATESVTNHWAFAAPTWNTLGDVRVGEASADAFVLPVSVNMP